MFKTDDISKTHCIMILGALFGLLIPLYLFTNDSQIWNEFSLICGAGSIIGFIWLYSVAVCIYRILFVSDIPAENANKQIDESYNSDDK